MKLLYIHQHFTTPAGAGGTRSYEMARKLVARGHQVTMVCGSYAGGNTGLTGPFLRGVRSGSVEGIDVIEFNLSYANKDGFLTRVRTFVRFAARSTWIAVSQPFDLVFATTTPLTAGIPGIAARSLRGRRFVFEVRDLWPELPKAMGVIRNPVILGAMSVLEWLSYRLANRLIGLAPGIVEGIEKHGIDPKRIAFVPNGCDLSLFGGDIPAWRPLTVKTDSLLAVFTGTHGQANGLDAVLDAAAVLKQRGRSDIEILLVGDGRQKPDLQRRAAAEGLSNVHFHDPINKRQLATLMKGADIGLQTLANIPAFYNGTSPNKFFDYMAAGLPVINNYPGWIAQLIEANTCGFAVPPHAPEAFADVLVHAADHREQLVKMGRNAAALAEREFDRAALSDKWVDWIEGTA